MSLSHKNLRGLIGAGLLVTASVALAGPATADETELQTLRAPFTCGSEWSGVTRPGHGLNDWNLDLNRTSRTYDDPQHDLGQPLLAQADGTIVWIGWHSSAGTYVEIDYGDITARYIHVVDHSVPEGLEIGSPVVEGQLFGLLGDTGNATHAHLHLEYFDSREYDDARAWLLPAENQIRIAMDGEVIDPGEVFTSTNCDGEPIPTTTTTPPPHPFTDVDEASFAHDDIVLLHELAITTGTTATTYSPDDDVTREQMAAFLARLVRVHVPDIAVPEGDHPFDDVDEDSFAHADVHLLFDLGITTGTGPATYSPDDLVTREQMAAFLNRLHDVLAAAADPTDETAESLVAPSFRYPFDDVTPESFAYDDIGRIHELGITTGTTATTYSPDADVTREQMAAFLARVHRLLGPDVHDHDHDHDADADADGGSGDTEEPGDAAE